MFTVNVRDHIMIAHSFKGDVFGPAQRLHGATYIVDWELRRQDLDAYNIVVDIGAAGELLKSVLQEFNFQNLDDRDDFAAQNTTTEFVARAIFVALRNRIALGELGVAITDLHSMRVCLHESHVAWAAYEAELNE
ncbi:MAG: 6-carboxytetrahydropterin synthase [Gammaproteobacteria bacterium]|nr:6-carboxytetrahydropterin synthase [Gammaproteobacteria bacterium]